MAKTVEMLTSAGTIRIELDDTAAIVERHPELPSRNPVTPGDIVSTMYHCLGIEPDTEMHDRLARPFPLVPAGSVVGELLA